MTKWPLRLGDDGIVQCIIYSTLIGLYAKHGTEFCVRGCDIVRGTMSHPRIQIYIYICIYIYIYCS